ncbi:pyrokinin-1 receptor [Nasonia vitripennis]|uniref:G-protein coupled receptors family 1 profile domain-containing protein n=1 Tax=Nasonia vitripennis TaxID=7425 RepID=A0A7M7G2T8_NASVI|nr:pyrokinin-1 receptor [Nasonia vitripennis]
MLNESFVASEYRRELGWWNVTATSLQEPLVDRREDDDDDSIARLLRRDPLYIVLPISILYTLIFITGLVGNVSTCVVIARNKCMHTATNYYLFSLAISDLLLLISGLPPEIYYIWSNIYVFGETFCVVQSFAAETSANATVLTITAFTVERYVAICHPFISHTMSKLSRAVKYVIAIWLLALCLAIPQAIQFGIVYNKLPNGTLLKDSAMCSVKWRFIHHAFEISTILFFVVPMTLITALYILIGVKLRTSRLLSTVKRIPSGQGLGQSDSRSKSCSQRNVIRMLVAVVVAFFICWAPFHSQRLLAVYAENNKKDEDKLAIVKPVYTALTYISGIFYYLSTTINPLLYNIMSNKFREAFKAMLSKHCGSRLQKSNPGRPTYSSLSRYPRSTIHRVDPQVSASLSVSEETQKLSPTAAECPVEIISCSRLGYCGSPAGKNEPNEIVTENILCREFLNNEPVQSKCIKPECWLIT